MDDSELMEQITTQIEKHKHLENRNYWWITDLWRTRFLRRYNFKYKGRNLTAYNWESLKDALIPSLIMSSAINRVFEIKDGEGMIMNADESLTYRWVQSSKSWTV